MRTQLLAALAAVALGALTACGDEDGTTAQDPASTPDGTSRAEPSGSPEPGSLPDFAADDYTYTLEIMCFCPITGPVEVTVREGRAVDAVTTRNGRGVRAGDPAPEFYLMTIDDVIAEANDPDADEVDVVWREGSDFPTKVSIDRDTRATDDEVTYTIRDVVQAAE